MTPKTTPPGQTVLEITQTVRTYGHTEKERTFRVTIPTEWKITFGSFNPGKGMDPTTALRIYESETKQRACFLNVTTFRDIGIPMVVKTRTEVAKSKANVTKGRNKLTEVSEVDVEYTESWEDAA